MLLGFSLYFNSGLEKNCELIKRFSKAGFTKAFTSLHIPEESQTDYMYDINVIFEYCKTYNIALMVDIGPRTIEKLGYTSICQLKDTPIRYLRIDYGFTLEEMVDLSKDFAIIFNASTISFEDIITLKHLNADLTKFSACHNFYPKPFSAISIGRAQNINRLLKHYGINIQMFVPGDKDKRGPIFAGLPTIESHRNQDVLLSTLELKYYCDVDDVFVGDVDVSDSTLHQLSNLSKNYVELEATLDETHTYLFDQIHHDRPDSSDYVIRSQESRMYATPGQIIMPKSTRTIHKGDILMSNELYFRYSGELEIARMEMPANSRINVIGRIAENYIQYLPYIDRGMGFVLKETK